VPAFEQQRSAAEIHNRTGIMADKQQRASFLKLSQEAHALLYEKGVPHRKCLVDDQDVGVKMPSPQSKSHVHAA
jgi:hypothetical protein